MGDINIDFMAIDKSEDQKTPHQKTHNPLIKIIKENLLEKGIKILNKESTFKRGNYKSMLDVAMSNKVNKIQNMAPII